MKKALMISWLAVGLYFVIAAIGQGSGWTATAAMFSGFMVARNMADVVQSA